MKRRLKLTGFDRTTGRVVVSHDIPSNLNDLALLTAGVDPKNPAMVGDVFLRADQAKKIANALGVAVATNSYDFFLEQFAPLPAISRAAIR